MKKPCLAFVIILSLVLQGCSAPKIGYEQASPDIAGITLNVVTPFGSGDGYEGIYTDLVKSFEDATGVMVNDNSHMSSEAWKQSVIQSFKDDEEPDVLFFFNGPNAESFIQGGKVVDIETIRNYRPQYASHITLGVLNTLKAQDGLNYCVPVTGFWEGLFINSDLFEKHNVEIPSTMEELFSVIEAFRQAGVTPIAINLNDTPHYWFEYLIYNYTGPSNHPLLMPNRTDAFPESWLSGLNTFQALYDKNAFPDDLENVTDDICLEMFNNKEAAMMLSGSWTSGAITDISNVKVVPVPAVNTDIRQATDIIGGFSMGFYITEKAWTSEKKEAALRFVESMIDEEALSKFNAGGGASPAPLQGQSEVTPLISSAREYVASATAFAPAIQDSFVKEAREYLFSQIMPIAAGEADVREVLRKYVELNSE